MDATKRFSERVENYRRYRPGYPPELLRFLADELRLRAGCVVADIGSGTGLLSGLLLESGAHVIGIEPNREMREAAEKALASHPRFRSVEAVAEATSLPGDSVDLITAAQAFHWFNVEQIRVEWARILRPAGNVALIWNERSDESGFMREAGQLIDSYAERRDPAGAIREAGKSRIGAFFAPHPVRLREFPHRQDFDFAGLLGRVASSSYLPNEVDDDFEPMAGELRRIFEKWQQHGTVAFEYRTRVYYSGGNYSGGNYSGVNGR